MALPILSHFYRRQADAAARGGRGLVRAKYLDASAASADAESGAKDARIRAVTREPLAFGECEAVSGGSSPETSIGAAGPDAVGSGGAEGLEIEEAPESFEAYPSGTFRAVRA